MKIQIIGAPLGLHTQDEIIDAALAPNLEWAAAYDSSSCLWTYYRGAFKVIPEEQKTESSKIMTFAEYFGGQQLSSINFK